MDLDPEEIRDLLNEIGLLSTLADLKNPTEEYVINLLTQFLNRLLIDLDVIRRPTVEQMSGVSLAEDNAEIVSLINLSAAMAGICNQIFLRDFFLTDLTSPTSKKTRKLARVLSNFLLYVLNKQTEIDKRLEEIKERRQHLEDINRKTDKNIELKRQKQLDIAKKIELKEQLDAKVARMVSLKGTRKPKIAQLQEKLKALETEKREISQRHGTLAAEAIKMRKVTDDLESKFVKSPARFESRLKELLEKKKNQMEKCEVMQEAVMSKKPAIERIQSHLTVVSNVHAELPDLTEPYKRLTNSKKMLEKAKKKVAEMNLLIKKETADMPTHETTATDSTILQKTEEHCDQSLAPIRNELTKLLNEKNSLECKLINDQTRQQKLFSERDEIRMFIKKTESETDQFIAHCQELYDNEINQQRRLKSSLEKDNLEPCT